MCSRSCLCRDRSSRCADHRGAGRGYGCSLRRHDRVQLRLLDHLHPIWFGPSRLTGPSIVIVHLSFWGFVFHPDLLVGGQCRCPRCRHRRHPRRKHHSRRRGHAPHRWRHKGWSLHVGGAHGWRHSPGGRHGGHAGVKRRASKGWSWRWGRTPHHSKGWGRGPHQRRRASHDRVGWGRRTSKT